MWKKRIYLDNSATTSLDPRVKEVMIAAWDKGPCNPSSIHFFGQEAKKALSHARETVANFFHVHPDEITFTSGGTESMTLLLQGLAPKRPAHLITTDLEHACVYENMKALESKGHAVTFLSPGLKGAPTVEEVAAALRPNTHMIVLSAANSETGVKIDLNGIAKLAEEKNVVLVIDGVALLGKEHFSLPHGVAAAGFSGHKIHGPQGTGCIYLRKGTPLSPLFPGGIQERGLRGGTENFVGILGFAKAISLLDAIDVLSLHIDKLRKRFETKLQAVIPDLEVNGTGPRTTHVSNVVFPKIDGETLLIHLDLEGIAASHASACSSGAMEVSRVLLNMGLSREKARTSLRFSFSRMNTEEEIDSAIKTLLDVVSGVSAATS